MSIIRQERVQDMMTHKEINHQILQDYVLGLLSPAQETEVATHLAVCTACQRIVLDERAVGTLVRGTLIVAARPDKARLRQLMPPPGMRLHPKAARSWAGRMAPVLAVLFLLIGTLFISLPESKRSMSLFIPPTATATSTNTPTATIAQQSTVSTGRVQSLAPDESTDAAPGLPDSPPGPLSAAPVPATSPTPFAVAGWLAAN